MSSDKRPSRLSTASVPNGRTSTGAPPAFPGVNSARQSKTKLSFSGGRSSRSSVTKKPSKSSFSGPPPPPSPLPPSSAGSSGMSGPCGHEITIPPQLPDILKMYVKAAMRTQPPELLRWSGAYFRAVANGEILPVKDKLEQPLRQSPDGLTAGLLRVIDAQLGGKSGQKIAGSEVTRRWTGLGLEAEALTKILQKAQMPEGSAVDWDKLIVVMTSTIGNRLRDSMEIYCNVLTDQPEGTDPVMNYTLWFNAYVYLAQLNGVPPEKIQTVDLYLQWVTKQNRGLISPSHFTNGGCPPLE